MLYGEVDATKGETNVAFPETISNTMSAFVYVFAIERDLGPQPSKILQPKRCDFTVYVALQFHK